MFSKKGLGPVVATALLLVVAVAAVVGFQSWFSTYNSSLFTGAEVQSNAASNNPLEINRLIGDTLYIVNSNQNNLSVEKLEIDNNDCTLNQNLSPGVNQIDVSSCLENSTTVTPEIVLISEDIVLSKEVFVDKTLSTQLTSTSLTQSDCDAIPYGDWVLVPGNPTLGTNDFCVMKYEAKQNGSNPTSTAASTPWVSINQTDARLACSNLGANYQLITDAQWVTIARNAENVASNWADETIGSTVASGGGLKRGNVGIDDSASYNAASDPADRSLDTNSKAMFTLSNGEEIWDISGNVWERTNDTFDTNVESALGQASSGWYEWTEISGFDYLESSNSLFNATHGVGRIYTDVNDAFPSGTVHSFVRGGRWDFGASAGAFALYLNYAPSYSDSFLGFRCSYTG